MSEEKIFIERNSPSDEEFLVHKIFVSNGEFVKTDTLLAEVEGAKAVFEIYSEREGYFFTKFQPGDYINIDTAFAVLSDTDEFKDKNISDKKEDIKTNNSLNFSKPAEKYILENNIEMEPFHDDLINIDLITVEDIKKFLTPKNETSRFEIEIVDENINSWKEKIKNKENKEPIFIVGGGYGAYQVLELIIESDKYYPEGYFDDNENTKLDYLGIKNYGKTDIDNINETLKKYDSKNLTVAISNNPEIRAKFLTLKEHKINLTTLIHPSAVIGSNVKIGGGTTIFANVHIGPDTEIGEMSFISSNSTIEHHNKLGEAFCCGPNFSTSGIVEIGNLVRAGINVGIEPFLKIGNNVVLASGVIVTKSIEDGSVIKQNKS